jgi:hypothetical protein
MGLCIEFLTAILFCGATCFSQARQSRAWRRYIRGSIPAYLKSYEETPFCNKVALKNGMTVLVDEYRNQPVSAQYMFMPDPLTTHRRAWAWQPGGCHGAAGAPDKSSDLPSAQALGEFFEAIWIIEQLFRSCRPSPNGRER